MVLKIATINIQGMNNCNKPLDVKNFINKINPSVVCIQETNLDPTIHNTTTFKNYNSFYNPMISPSSGTLSLVHCSLPVLSYKILFPGRVHVVSLSICDFTVHVLNVYLPHKDNIAIACLVEIDKFCQSTGQRDLILAAGDWNFTELAALDRINSKERRKHLSSKMQRVCTNNSLSDSYRLLHPDGNDMTHVGTQSHRPMARLDRIYVSSSQLHAISSHIILPFPSDHAAVLLSLNLAPRNKCQLWKFDNELLKCDIFTTSVRCLLDEFSSQEHTNLQDYELLKSEIKICSMQCAAFLRKQKQLKLQNASRVHQADLDLAAAHPSSSSVN